MSKCECDELPDKVGATFTFCGNGCRRIEQFRAREAGKRADLRHPVWLLLDRLQMDNREQAAKLVELRSYIASLSLPDPKRRECPECGTAFRNELVMAEHRYSSHSGPVPEHYLAAERAAGLQDDPTPVPAAP